MICINLKLIPYPKLEKLENIQISTQIEVSEKQILKIKYIIEGDVKKILWPQEKQAERKDELWKHTCFELFVKQPEAIGYCEFNFSPSKDWNAYEFSDYREGMKLFDSIKTIPINMSYYDNRVELSAIIELPNKGINIGISAVLEDKNNKIFYFALKHNSIKPDFHDPSTFIQRI